MKAFYSRFKWYAATTKVCQVLKTTSISHKEKQIATDADNYTPNYIESKMFRYMLNSSRINNRQKILEWQSCKSSKSANI